MKVLIRETGDYMQIRTLPNGFPVGELKSFKIGNTVETDKVIPSNDGTLILMNNPKPFEDLVVTHLPLGSCGLIC